MDLWLWAEGHSPTESKPREFTSQFPSLSSDLLSGLLSAVTSRKSEDWGIVYIVCHRSASQGREQGGELIWRGKPRRLLEHV